MPKDNINYSNTIFYKIFCTDDAVKDVYIGHTTNFVQRKYTHKQACTTETHPKYGVKLYDFIRRHGGWHHWDIKIIGCHECIDHNEAKNIENCYIKSINATLNDPIQSMEEDPEECSKYNKNTTKKILKYFCEDCDFTCSRKSNYDRHLATRKHQDTTEIQQKSAAEYYCDCGKKYSHRASLFNHKKRCSVNEVTQESLTTKIDSNMVLDLIRQNKELQKQLLELAHTKQDVIIQHTSNNSNSSNNNTNNFNISVFLNEHCKNAINFSDFINNIYVSREDLQNNAQLGFVGGISKIITDNLKMLTLHERPIHCTDVKRETMYIRDDNSWKKDKDFVQESLNRAIQEVSRKSVVSLMEWKQTNPDYADMDSDFSNLCLVMHQQSIAGYNRDKYYPKVIRRIAECVPCKNV